MRRLFWIVVLVWACSTPPAAQTPEPTPEPVPVATPAPALTDVQMAAAVQDNILTVYGEKPRPSWWKYLHLVSKQPDVWATGASNFVGTLTGASAKVMKAMCVDIAAVHFDANAHDLGFTHVHLFDGSGEEIVGCKIPGY